VRKHQSKNAQLEFLKVLETAHEADIQQLEKDDNTLDILAHAFLPEHPLHKTHAVSCNPSRLTTFIPNFVGGTLPRADQGDREFYCCTMLTLLIPWRTGKELKQEGESWHDTFTTFPFSPKQK